MWSLSGPSMMQLDWFGLFTEQSHPLTKNIESFERDAEWCTALLQGKTLLSSGVRKDGGDH